MAKWMIDPGHGGTDSGATNKYVKEKDINLIVALEVKRVLELNGQTVSMTRTTDKTVSLSERCTIANNWGADYFVSVHHNAGGGDGLEVIHSIYHGVGEQLAHLVANTLSDNTGQNIRRVFSRKGDNGDYYAVIRGTKMPAIITEFGFLDNAKDYEAFDTEEELIQEGRFIAAGCLKLIGITNVKFTNNSTPTTTPPTNTTTKPTVMYRVIMDGVQIMALSDYDAACNKVKERVDGKLNKEGKVQRNTDGVDLFKYPSVSTAPTETTQPKTEFKITTGIPIMGKSILTAEQMATHLLTTNPKPKITGVTDYKSCVEFCKLYIEEGEVEGVRGDIAFCQSLHETGYFAYGGLVLPEQNNYAGIGATNNSSVGKGAWFDTPRIGVRAQIQHLKAYATSEKLKNECVDPRYSLVSKGVAPYFEALAGRWAYPGFNTTKYDSLEAAYKANATYGQFILALFEKIKIVKIETPKVEVKKSKYFDDIPENHWSIDYFDKASEIGIISGVSDRKVGFTEDLARIITIQIKSIAYIESKLK